MNKLSYLPIIVAALLTLAACANIGHPTGGPRDVTPPRYVGSNPRPGATNVKSNKISIYFDENVQLDDPNSKVAISPAQKEMPELFANGRRLDITLRDSLIPGMTYTIDLADAVKDLNEGNVLDGLAIDFSTGDSIDTLQISGMVLHARDLEPAQGMLVGVYSTPADSNILTRRFERIARTNQYGQFTVRNLAPGEYQLFALTDVNRDYFWDRTEDVAFSSVMLSPSAALREVSDTVADDSIVMRTVVDHLPNNVLLTWFNEEYQTQYLKNYKREKRNQISLEMAAPADSMAELTIVQLNSDTALRIPLDRVALLTHSARFDTIRYWLRDSAVIAADTMMIETRYRRVDTLGELTWATDTLKFNFRTPKNAYVPKTLQEKIDSIRKKNDTIPIDTFALLQPSSFLGLSILGGTQDVNRPLRFAFGSPIDSLPAGAVRIEYCPDSVFVALEPQPLILPADSGSHVNFVADVKWVPGGKYRIAVDSLAVTDVQGLWTRNIDSQFNVRSLDEYSSVKFTVSGLPDSVAAIVELLDEQDKPVRAVPVSGSTAQFEYLLPATYYARLFIDADGNGLWTNGDLKLRRQPEDVYYFPKKLALKKNWDRSEDWDINALAVDMQKPDAIKKNKPRKAAGEINAETDPDDIDPEDLPYNPYEQL